MWLEERTKAFGAPTPSEKANRNKAVMRREAKARRRFAIAKAIASVEGSYRAKVEFVEKAIATGFIPPGDIPSAETLRNWERKWHAGAQTIADWLDRPRSGRPRRQVNRKAAKRIQEVIYSGVGVSAHQLHRELRAEGHPISYRQVHRRFAEAGRLVRAAARHGSLAGELDGLPHARVRTKYTHETWALDELTVPVWVRVRDDVAGQWVSARSDAVLIVDVASGAIVGIHVVDPSVRRDETGRVMRAGFDSNDVLGALLSAAVPDLAWDSTRDFAGYLPERIRWDNAQAHKTVRKLLEDARVEVDIRPIRKRRAASNGAVERRVKIVKDLCRGIFGHIDDYLPTDRVTEYTADQPRLRTLTAGLTNLRETRRTEVMPDDLLTVEELRDQLDPIVGRYNYKHVSRVTGTTAAELYHARLRNRTPRRGLDLVRTIQPRTVTVGTSGIVHTDGGRTFEFFPYFDGVILALDQEVTYYPDPLNRGIFACLGTDRVVFRQAHNEYSDEEAKLVGRNASAIARQVSDHAEQLRKQKAAERVGTEGLEAAREDVEVRVEDLKRVDGDIVMERPQARALPADDPDLNAIWDADAESFLRRAEEDE